MNLKGIDLAAELEALAQTFDEEVETAALAEGLQRILMRFGDGHASVSSNHAPYPSLFPPVLLSEADGGVVAYRHDRSGFLSSKKPFVLSIDGHSIERWTDWLRPWIVDGSEQFVRFSALRSLREIALWRERLGHPASESVIYELASKPSAKSGKKLTIPLGTRRPTYGAWPQAETRELKHEFGYLRLDQMDDDRVPDLRRAMQNFRDSKGLIVDVRGNGGGSRGLLLALAGYLLGPEEQPWVGNVAVYRDSKRFRKSHLEARFMYRAGDAHWNKAQALAIQQFDATFEPEWDPGKGFSAWHYLVLDKTGHADEYFYDKPVVVLSDAGCFSATDIFLGALKAALESP